MVKLLDENRQEFNVKVDDLIALEDAGLADTAGVKLARRELDTENIESLVMSDPRTWPPILVTRTDRGYIIIDGYHRKEAARQKETAIGKKLEEMKATCKAFQSEQEIIEATFRANLSHGLRASTENRSNYAYWLHKTFPQMKQEEIAARVGVKQSTVSKAIFRREAATRKAARTEAQAERPEQAPEEKQHEEQREHARKDFQSLTRDAIRFAQDISNLERREQREIIIDTLPTVEDREMLLSVALLVEEILQPPSPTRGRRKQ